jgi:tRNA(Arg) A34 adenosine deaminase TadA
MDADPGFRAAVEEARQGAAEGGVPIGACLVAKDGTILGRGHNMRVQKGSAILHVSAGVLLCQASCSARLLHLLQSQHPPNSSKALKYFLYI